MAKFRIQNKRKQDLIFYVIMLAYPVLQFCIFYIGVNFNSILMAFQKYSHSVGNRDFYEFLPASEIFSNFSKFFALFDVDSGAADKVLAYGSPFKNAFIAYAVSLIIVTPISIIFSYYVFKKYPAHGLIKVVLFAPSIICGIVPIAIYTQIVDALIPAIFDTNPLFGMNGDAPTAFNMVLFYCVWLGFGGGILLYVGAMNNISDSVIEACKLDGANSFQEIIYIVLPLIYPTFVTFLVVGVSGIFTNQMGLFGFFSTNAAPKIQTFGYWFFLQTKIATGVEAFYVNPMLSAIGILMTIIVAPITLLVKWALEKFGPRVD